MSRRPLLFCRGAILLAACRAAPAFNSPCRRSQTMRRDAALVSRPKEQATRPRVLLWGRLGPDGAEIRLPFCPRDRTSPTKPAMSVSCPVSDLKVSPQGKGSSLVSATSVPAPSRTALGRHRKLHPAVKRSRIGIRIDY